MRARVARLDELQTIHVAGIPWRPVRRALGITAFGINAYGPVASGELVVEPHDEAHGGAGRHEEAYVVLRGRASFTIDGEALDAPAGTLVFLPEPEARREAVAAEDGTMVLAIGGRPGAALPPSAWEFSFAAAAEEDPARRYEVAAEGLADHPEHPSLHYNLACFAALAGRRDDALRHLRIAFDGDPRTREWAKDDSDLDAIRDDAGWPE